MDATNQEQLDVEASNDNVVSFEAAKLARKKREYEEDDGA